jgi:hypothetical protein
MDKPPSSQPSSLPRRPWSLYVFIAWALIMAFNTGLRLWVITGPLAQLGSPDTVIGWLGLGLAFIAPFGFGLSAYGLWELRPWGRTLFLVMAILFFGFNAIGVWLPGGMPLDIHDHSPAEIRNSQLLATARYGLSLIIPLGYLNLRWVKHLFRKSANQQISKSANQGERNCGEHDCD